MTAKFEDLRQSEEWAEYLSQLGWLAVRAKINPEAEQARYGAREQRAKIFVRKLPLVGAVGKIQRPSVIPPIEEIDRIAKKYRTLFIKLEPGLGQHKMLQLPQHQTLEVSVRGRHAVGKHFEADIWPLVPTRTIHLDLTPSEEEIFAKFSKDARYSIRRAQKLGVVVVCKDCPFLDLHIFYQLLRETGKRKKFWVAPFRDLQAKAEAFKDKSALIFAYHNSENLPAGRQAFAGALILFHDRVAYYHQAASSPEGRKLLAPYLVVWEAIKVAKKKGCHTLDLEGIYDPRYKIYKRFRKIGVFKKKFGGKEVKYPGSFIRYYNPIIKTVFKLTSSWR